MGNEKKLALLREWLKAKQSVLVAFSGGVDSTFLARVAHDILIDKALAVTVASQFSSASEIEQAKKIAALIGIKHKVVQVDILAVKEVAANPPERCYYCKRRMFQELRALADRENIPHLADGESVDDLSEFRPGRKAVAELGALSPLRDLCFTKGDIRDLAREMKLPNWDKPASPCLATRIMYGQHLDHETLNRIDLAETFLHTLGFKQCRARDHGGLVRVELTLEDMGKIDRIFMELLSDKLLQLGFRYATLDLTGFRSGSMNAADVGEEKHDS
jgi:uncharacterized protein